MRMSPQWLRLTAIIYLDQQNVFPLPHQPNPVRSPASFHRSTLPVHLCFLQKRSHFRNDGKYKISSFLFLLSGRLGYPFPVLPLHYTISPIKTQWEADGFFSNLPLSFSLFSEKNPGCWSAKKGV